MVTVSNLSLGGSYLLFFLDRDRLDLTLIMVQLLVALRIIAIRRHLLVQLLLFLLISQLIHHHES